MSGTVTASGSVQLPDWVNQAALTNYQTAMNLSQQPYTPYTGQEIAGFTPLQNQAFGAIQGMPSTAPTFSGAISNVQNLPATTQSLLNPYLSNVEADTVSNIQREAALQGQTIAAGAQQGGAYGGTRYGVQQATLDSETQRNIGQAIDSIQSQGWNTASQTALQQAQQEAALATAGQTAGLQLTGAQAQVGSVQQQQQQAQLAQQLSQWQQQQNWPYQQLAVAQSALAGSPYGTTTTSSQPYTSSTLANALSTMGTAIPAIGGLVQSGTNLYNNLFGNTGNQFTIPASGTSPITSSQAMSFANPSTPVAASDYSNPFSYSAGDLSGVTNMAGDTSGGLSNFLSDASSSGSAGSMFNSFFGA